MIVGIFILKLITNWCFNDIINLVQFLSIFLVDKNVKSIFMTQLIGATEFGMTKKSTSFSSKKLLHSLHQHYVRRCVRGNI